MSGVLSKLCCVVSLFAVRFFLIGRGFLCHSQLRFFQAGQTHEKDIVLIRRSLKSAPSIVLIGVRWSVQCFVQLGTKLRACNRSEIESFRLLFHYSCK